MENVNWLYQLKPVNFTYKEDENHVLRYGLIAEEVEKVNADFVTYNDDGTPEAIDYNALIAPMIKALQEQQKMIEELQHEVERLREAVSSR